ncbi:M23 family metallopeptidase [Streptomyces katsurahamanus]|uniref:M23 family metallopeptidase n=1 Tax=Streptomyces katsurahamanus TaxID=2577098 RepID=A0ABW9NLV3_9ACTN|nr:M23 family metallopeptidase [Streptomyces katsurahamanus]MQS34290.1 M23 family metallopeptidase [Streptomyces katsurahamanus]
MNDQHAHAGHVGHDNYPTGSFDIDPLFGALPDHQGGYEAGHSGQWDTGSLQTADAGYDPYPAQEQVQQLTEHDTGRHDTTGHHDTAGQHGSGQWDATVWNQPVQPVQQDPFDADAHSFGYDTTQQWTAPTFGTGSYDTTDWNTADPAPELTPDPMAELSPEFAAEAPGYPADYESGFESGFDADLHTEVIDLTPASDDSPGIGDTASLPVIPDADPEDEHRYEHELDPITAVSPIAPRSVRRSGGGGSRGRRRTPAKRSALFTVAVPSACVMGVAGIAAASVGGLGGGEAKKQNDTKLAAADVAETAAKTAAANNKMDTQLAALDAEARDFGDRASRTQERIDLKARQEADRQKREEEAKRREALRPKFALPVASRGLSTYYGESGVNWMALHTGIDFPVPYGTNVFAASDGTIRTQYNSAYGNMIILTAPDGTETWYCHLSSAKIRSGPVKAGDVIGYAGNSGNSTGPHLHFEVRPGGGSTIDPLKWLQSKGLSPV